MEDWNWETIFTDYIGLYSTTVTYLASKESEIDFLLVLIKLFSLGCTAEALTKIDRKSAISLQRGHFDPKFQVEGDVPQQ